MGRNYTKKREPYNQEDMKNAIQAVRSGQMGYKKAATTFNVKRETLRDQVRQRYASMGPGRKTYLTSEEEDELVKCLKIMARWGFGFTNQEVLHLVGEYAASKPKNPFKNGMPSEDWLSGFFKRHPTLTSRLPEQMKTARAKSTANATIVEEWFDLVKSTLEENNLMNSPHRIFNVDETGMPLDPKRLRVICEKNISHLFRVIGGSGRDSITVNGCASASGVMLPPYVIYAAKNLRSEWTKNGPANCRYTTSEKGWMDSICFLDWFEKLFIPCIPTERPVVLIFDGHRSHISVPLIMSAVKNNVILLKLPPNSTHNLQPLDVGVYGPLKTQWEKILIAYARQTLGTALTKEVFPSLLLKLWTADCLNGTNIKSGFARCGIFPFNNQAIPRSQYESSEIFDKVLIESDHQPRNVSNSSESTPSTVSISTLSPSNSFHQRTSTSPTSTASASTSATSPQPTTSATSPQPTTSSSSTTRPSTPNPQSESTNKITIKDFFMKKISPILQAKREGTKRKPNIRRQYGESLTSLEYIQRMSKEAEEKENTQKNKKVKAARRKGKSKIMPIVTDSEMEIDDSHDEDWVPQKRRKAISDDSEDSDDSDRNIFKKFSVSS